LAFEDLELNRTMKSLRRFLIFQQNVSMLWAFLLIIWGFLLDRIS